MCAEVFLRLLVDLLVSSKYLLLQLIQLVGGRLVRGGEREGGGRGRGKREGEREREKEVVFTQGKQSKDPYNSG